jgi:hypothetical protein
LAGVPADRLSRLATLFRFVSVLSEAHSRQDEPQDAVDVLLERLGQQRGPAVVLSALLLAVGERADLECTREMAFVRVGLEPEDLLRLPPHARLLRWRDRVYLVLDPRRAKSPFGFVPEPVREAMASRRRSGPAPRRLQGAWSPR